MAKYIIQSRGYMKVPAYNAFRLVVTDEMYLSQPITGKVDHYYEYGITVFIDRALIFDNRKAAAAEIKKMSKGIRSMFIIVKQ